MRLEILRRQDFSQRLRAYSPLFGGGAIHTFTFPSRWVFSIRGGLRNDSPSLGVTQYHYWCVFHDCSFLLRIRIWAAPFARSRPGPFYERSVSDRAQGIKKNPCSPRRTKSGGSPIIRN